MEKLIGKKDILGIEFDEKQKTCKSTNISLNKENTLFSFSSAFKFNKPPWGLIREGGLL